MRLYNADGHCVLMVRQRKRKITTERKVFRRKKDEVYGTWCAGELSIPRSCLSNLSLPLSSLSLLPASHGRLSMCTNLNASYSIQRANRYSFSFLFNIYLFSSLQESGRHLPTRIAYQERHWCFIIYTLYFIAMVFVA